MRKIATELGVALSSVSVWVRNVPLPPAQEPDPEPSDQARKGNERSPSQRSVLTDARPRRCGRCEQLLPLTAFNRHRDGYQWWCRDCFRDYFRERGALHLQQVKASSIKRRDRARNQVYGHLERNPCSDCGERDPVVLEFDHVAAKSQSVATLVYWGASRGRIETEISCCEVVCANCHRRRTARRIHSWRLDPAVLESRPLRPEHARNLKVVLAALSDGGCVDCGQRDLLVLEFDHVGPKRAAVSALARQGCSVETLNREIRQCVVRCANCHRRRTAERGGHFRHRHSAII